MFTGIKGPAMMTGPHAGIPVLEVIIQFLSAVMEHGSRQMGISVQRIASVIRDIVLEAPAVMPANVGIPPRMEENVIMMGN